jgi:hypothetical protein
MRKLLVSTLLTTTLLAACSSTPEIQTGDDAEVIAGNLHKVDKAKTDLAYIDPQADFSKYNKVLLRPLGVDNIEVVQPSSGSVRGNRNWEITDKDKDLLRSAYHDAMVKQLQDKGDYPIVTEPGDDVLEIVAVVTGVAPSAARDNLSAGRSKVYTDGAGSIAVMVVYGDSETGEVLGLAKDSRSSNSYWGQNNSVSNSADVRRIFEGWALQIRNGLDRVQEK